VRSHRIECCARRGGPPNEHETDGEAPR
jgi:hypothetical protein